MICPFWRQPDLLGNLGPTICPSCRTEFEIDDRGEYVSVDANSLRMPKYGQVCPACGLIQQDQRDSCVYCGSVLNNAFH